MNKNQDQFMGIMRGEEEPMRHVGKEDWEAAKKSREKYEKEHKAFERGEIKTANERFSEGLL
jgi:hypothetical protein